jgi:nucleoside 2-deoxyribosyltransferase
MVRIYVASPLGFSGASEPFYKATLLRGLREAGLTAVDPWGDRTVRREVDALFAKPLGAPRRRAFTALNRRVGAANAEKIARAHAILAVLDGVDVDSGTAAEIGFAAALGKPVVGLRLDTRQAGDNEGAIVNLQVEYFIRASEGDIVVSDGRNVSRSVRTAVAMLVHLTRTEAEDGAPSKRASATG